MWHLLNAAKGGNWLHPSIVDGRMDGRVDEMWHLLNTAKGGNWLHPSIVDGRMDGRVDKMKKTSFHHDHDVLYIY